MAFIRLLLLAGTALATSAGAATAQTTPASQQTPPARTQPPAEEETAVDAVVVTARQTDVRTSIDAVSYSLADDLQATTGSLADALRNLPSVEVDPDGNVSLRGDPNVTILVDGRPSTLLSGESRAQVLRQLPADRYARIEVMTNPSAAYSPEGTAGVINLITKPTPQRPGVTSLGSVQANVGDNGSYNLGFNGSRSQDRLALTLDAGLRHDVFEQTVDRLRERFDIGSSQFLEARQAQITDGVSDNAYVRASADYKLDDKTQLTGELRYTDIDNAADGLDVYEADNASGGIASAYTRRTDGGYAGEFAGLTGRVVRRFDDQGHEWSTELRLDRVRAGFLNAAVTEDRVPVAPDAHETVQLINNVDQLGLVSAYVRPLSDGGKLRAGYDLRLVALELDNIVRRGPSSTALTLDPLVSNQYHVDEAVHAAYVTFEHPFTEKLTAQFGLRAEQVERELDQATSGIQWSDSYFRLYPTFHLAWALAEGQSLRASYGRRVQRPRPSELNPFLTYQDPQNYSSGNPDLEPQETDAFELMWQKRVQQTFWQATLYHRDTQGAFTPVTTSLGGGVFLTRPENLGARTDTGLELVATGQLHPTLRYNASINLFHQEIDASNIPGGVSRSGDVASGRLNLNWTPSEADFVQLSTVWTGDQLLAQGTRESSTLVNLGYRHKLGETLSLTVTVRDLFDDFSDVVSLDTSQFRDRTNRWMGGRTGFIGLSWSFGQGRRPQEPQFDFTAPTTGT